MPSFLITAGVNRMFSSVGAPSCGGSRHSSLNTSGGLVAGGAAAPRPEGACANAPDAQTTGRLPRTLRVLHQISKNA